MLDLIKRIYQPVLCENNKSSTLPEINLFMKNNPLTPDNNIMEKQTVDEKATSKKQQRFMGMVHAIQKGEMEPDEAGSKVQKAAKTMNPKDAEDFAATKHKGLPEKAPQNEGELDELSTGFANRATNKAAASRPSAETDPIQFAKRSNMMDSMSTYINPALKPVFDSIGAVNYWKRGSAIALKLDAGNGNTIDMEINPTSYKVTNGTVSQLPPERLAKLQRGVQKLQADLKTGMEQPIQENVNAKPCHCTNDTGTFKNLQGKTQCKECGGIVTKISPAGSNPDTQIKNTDKKETMEENIDVQTPTTTAKAETTPAAINPTTKQGYTVVQEMPTEENSVFKTKPMWKNMMESMDVPSDTTPPANVDECGGKRKPKKYRMTEAQLNMIKEIQVIKESFKKMDGKQILF